MADTKGDNKSESGELAARDTDEEIDKDKTDKNENDERNKVDDGDIEAQEKATVEEENAGTDATKDVADEDKDNGDKNDEEGEGDEEEAAAEDEEVEQDDASHHNKPEESAATDAEENTEAELQEDDDAVDQEEAEDKNEDAAAEGQEGEGEEGETEEAAEEEKQMTAESLDEDNTEQNGSRDLTEEDKTRCRYMFDKKAVNGRLDLKGFKTVFRVLGEILASEEAERMFEAGDRDDDDTLDFEEFFRLYAKFRQEEQARREAILDSVDKLFLCGSGDTIELKKVQQLLLKLQQPDLDIRLVREKSDLGEDEVKQMIKSLDKTGSGYISKEEFVDIMCQHLEI